MDDRDFEKRESRGSVAAWPLMSLVFIASALGAFGDGPLSRAEAFDPSGELRVEYDRVVRYGTTSQLQVFTASSADAVTITVDRMLLDAFHVRQIVPSPQSARLAGDGVAFVFAKDASATAPIVFEFESTKTGRVRGTIRSGGSAVALRQFILP